MKITFANKYITLISMIIFSAYGFIFAQEQPSEPDTTVTESPATPMAPAQQPEPGFIPFSSEFDLSIGYNLKVTIRLAPVYRDSSLMSDIVTRLPRGSVVGVLDELDTWYKIEFGPEDNRQEGWLIAYGVERTHELEHIVTDREDVNRWAGKRVMVVSGETAVRAFPSAAANVLIRAFRNEIFPIGGESQDYYMVELSNKVKGWMWKGDVEIYIEPKYSRDEMRAMIKSAKDQEGRIIDLRNLMNELHGRERKVVRELESLQKLKLQADSLAAAEAAALQRPPLFQLDSLKQRTSLSLGMYKQNFGAKLGLASTMFMGFGLNYRWSDHLSLNVALFSGTPLAKELGSEQAALPASMTGLDTLVVSGKFWQLGLSYGFGGLKGVPMLKNMDNYLYCGIGHLDLNSSAGAFKATQTFWGPLFGWKFGKKLFGRLSFEAGMRMFFTTAEVTDVRFSGTTLLEKEKVFLINTAMHGGVTWQF